jgi:hypothetical protein
MLCLCFYLTEMAYGQHGHHCQDLRTCQICLFSNSHPAAQLTNVHCTFTTKTHIQKLFADLVLMMLTGWLLLAVAAVWVLEMNV